jgi:hypothetical protein
VQHEVTGFARELHVFGHQAAQLINAETDANDRAMEFVRDVPQLAAARAGPCGGYLFCRALQAKLLGKGFNCFGGL